MGERFYTLALNGFFAHRHGVKKKIRTTALTRRGFCGLFAFVSCKKFFAHHQ